MERKKEGRVLERIYLTETAFGMKYFEFWIF
jgi:hypothetical protein